MEEENNYIAKNISLRENVAGLLSYLLLWVSGGIIFLLEKQNYFIRFHALQSIVFFGGATIIFLILAGIDWILIITDAWQIAWFSLVLYIIDFLAGLLLLVVLLAWITLMNKAYQGETFKLPVIGDFVAQRME